jgi:hypothetical protein
MPNEWNNPSHLRKDKLSLSCFAEREHRIEIMRVADERAARAISLGYAQAVPQVERGSKEACRKNLHEESDSKLPGR